MVLKAASNPAPALGTEESLALRDTACQSHGSCVSPSPTVLLAQSTLLETCSNAYHSKKGEMFTSEIEMALLGKSRRVGGEIKLFPSPIFKGEHERWIYLCD